MAWKKEVIDITPIEFNRDLKTVKLLTKKRAHQFIAFQLEEGRDKYFIDMNFISAKHFTIADSHFITAQDLDGWVRYMETKGWTPHKDIKGFLETLKIKMTKE